MNLKKCVVHRVAFAVICSGLGAFPALAEVPEAGIPSGYGVDLRDLAHYPTGMQSEARIILSEFARHPDLYFPRGVRLLTDGPGFSAQSRVNSVYGIEVVKKLQQTLVINALYALGKNQLFVRTFQFEISENALQNVQLLAEQPISDLSFEITVALAQRKMIVRSIPAGILKVYPLGVGSLDENTSQPDQVRILTPVFRGAVVERRYVESARTFPSYYRGRPFLRISVGTGNGTIYGFHYSITESLTRGFVSHGCMRMRDKDLYELYALVMGEKADAAPVTMAFRSDDDLDTPYPLNNKTYTRVKNFGSAHSPQVGYDREGLTVLETHAGAPPLNRLYDFLSSTYETVP